MPLQEAPGAVPNSGALEIMDDLRTLWAGALLKLFQSSLSPTPASVVADFDAAEADFTGYAAATITWSAAAPDADGGAVIVGSRAFFQATDAVTPNTIGGAWLEKATGELIGYFEFPAPVNISQALAFVAVTPMMRTPENSSAAVES